ncbi:hypothetical protein GQ42DRAFT_108685, partial [Ramicandelaber brevisporus]
EIKKRIRDTDRVLRREGLTATAKVDAERKRKALEVQLAQLQTQKVAGKVDDKYKMVKFFEKQKLLRKLKQVEKQLSKLEMRSSDMDSDKEHMLYTDVFYISHYPSGEKYISLMQSPNNDESARKRNEMRDAIRARIDAGELVMDLDKVKSSAEVAKKQSVASSASASSSSLANKRSGTVNVMNDSHYPGSGAESEMSGTLGDAENHTSSDDDED